MRYRKIVTENKFLKKTADRKNIRDGIYYLEKFLQAIRKLYWIINFCKTHHPCGFTFTCNLVINYSTFSCSQMVWWFCKAYQTYLCRKKIFVWWNFRYQAKKLSLIYNKMFYPLLKFGIIHLVQKQNFQKN